MYYNPSDEAKGKIGENLVTHTFTSHGYSVKSHDIYDPGCDGIFSGNGVILGGYEVNYWNPNSYFNDERIDKIDSNLYCGLEWEEENYVKHGDRMQYRFHFSFGATRTKIQIARAKDLGIIYIHTVTLPTSDKLWTLIAPFLGLNPYTKFYRINCIKQANLENDRTSMDMLVTPIISNIINSIQVITSSISIKIRSFEWKDKLKGSLLELKSSVKARLFKFHCSFSLKNLYTCLRHVFYN
jgi:hypothetical protein